MCFGGILSGLLGGQRSTPAPVIDPAAERRAAEAEAARKANAELTDAARRKRQQKGLLAGSDTVLGSAVTQNSTPNATVLGSGGS